jgi:hypothetical protein
MAPPRGKGGIGSHSTSIDGSPPLNVWMARELLIAGCSRSRATACIPDVRSSSPAVVG